MLTRSTGLNGASGTRRMGSLRSALAVAAAAFVVFAMVPSAHADEPAFTPNPHPHSVVVDWVDAMLLAIELNPPAPTATTWRMWVVASSMYDAWSAYDGTAVATASGYTLKHPARRHAAGSDEIAISYAAHRALTYLFPNQKHIFDEVLAYHGLAASSSLNPLTPDGLGNAAAQAVIDLRTNDGSNAAAGFAQITSATYPEPYEAINSADPSAPNAIGGPAYDPNYWTPLRVPTGALADAAGNPIVDHDDPATYVDQRFLTPHWGAVVPFALTSGDQFRPAAPPHLGSLEPYTDAAGNVSTSDAAFRSQTAAVLAASASLTDTDKVIAEFWADGPHTWTPPGHWVQIAIGVSLRDQHTTAEDARMYMALTGAVLDAGIASWEAKRAYDFVRPATAIPYLYAGQQVEAWGGPNQGTQWIDGADWRPYQSGTFVTPPFAEYISGHSTFSRASAEILTAFTGSSAMYDGVTGLGRDYDGDGIEDLLGRHVAVPGTLQFEEGPAAPVVLTWDTFLAAADEAGVSRRYGGIHFQDGDLRAREVGRQVGEQAYQWAELYFDPFSEVASTVAELGASRDLTRRAERSLTAVILQAERAFTAGWGGLGCATLSEFDAIIEGGRPAGVKPPAYQRLDRQVTLLQGSLCS